MKRSKLFLLPSTVVACATPILFSCGPKNLDIEDLENALFHPTEEQDNTKTLAEGIAKMVDDKDEIGIQKEIIYALYANYIFKPLDQDLPDGEGHWPTIDELYNDNFLNMSANIRRCSLEIVDSGYNISFLGYINFVFIKDFEGTESFKKGDFIQITYSIDNYHFTISNNALSGRVSEKFCFGFIQTNKWPIIKCINEFSGIISGSNKPHNWHNWTKTEQTY